MFDYDATLKSLLKAPATTTLREISGLTIKRWMNVEFSSVEQRRLDLLGESNERCLLHLELQSGNDTSMAWRDGVRGEGGPAVRAVSQAGGFVCGEASLAHDGRLLCQWRSGVPLQGGGHPRTGWQEAAGQRRNRG